MRNILISIFTFSVLLLIITHGCKKVDESTGIARINFNPLIDYGTLNDIEGNIYKTVEIGTQTWMAENLKSTRFNDGTAIDLVTDNEAWKHMFFSYIYCCYNNVKPVYKSTYGALYNFTTVTAQLCPLGWHLPSDDEWMTLLAFVSDSGKVFAGIKLKESDTTHWQGPDTGVTNESGFTALPGGYRDDQGIFMNGGNNGYWWSSTVSHGFEHFFGLSYKSNGSILAPFSGPENVGLSVRCLKDN